LAALHEPLNIGKKLSHKVVHLWRLYGVKIMKIRTIKILTLLGIFKEDCQHLFQASDLRSGLWFTLGSLLLLLLFLLSLSCLMVVEDLYKVSDTTGTFIFFLFPYTVQK
jgi:hypothetical protein